MATWWIHGLKAVLPHVATVISAATPVFTRKKTAAAANQSALLQEQVNELQAAVMSNAQNIKELAQQLQTTVATLEQAASYGETKLKLALIFCGIAVVCSLVALGVTVWLIFVFGR